MPANPNYRLAKAILDSDRIALLAIRDLMDYAPVNQHQSIESLIELAETLRQAEEAMVRAQTTLGAVRAALIAAGWDFHSAMLGAKTHIAAQYGDDAQVIRAIGLTRRSERKRPSRRPRIGV